MTEEMDKFYQCICANRHYQTVSELDECITVDGFKIEDMCCSECGVPYVWTNLAYCDNHNYHNKIEFPIDDNDMVAISMLNKLQQIKQEKETGHYHTFGEWKETRRHGQSDFIVSAPGVPVIAIVPLRDVSINTQKANTKAICSLPQMIKLVDRLKKFKEDYVGQTISDIMLFKINELLDEAEEISNKLMEDL
ncbi:MAG: hypothetical protein WCQ80_02610 [Bacilli bacterium]